jgi:hypothetical protein
MAASKSKASSANRCLVKYPGVLGEKPSGAEATVAFAKFWQDDQSLKNWRKEREARLLGLLCDHYKIPMTSNSSWRQLAFALAKDHVPAFSREVSQRRGRPKKLIMLSALMALNKKGKPGRKTTHTDVGHREILTAVREVCEKNNFLGHGRITKAIDHMITEFVELRGQGESAQQMIRKIRPKWRKRYSEAAKKFPELTI